MDSLSVQLNGRQRNLSGLASPCSLDQLIASLELKADRIAVEHNGQIVPRAEWPATMVEGSDKLEIVHFVGGGN